MSHETRFSALGLVLPPAPKPVGVYKPIVVVGNLAYLSGHGPLQPDGTLLVSYLRQSTIHLWDVRKGQEEPLPGLRCFPRGSWSFSADQQWILGLRQDGVGQLRNDGSGQVRQLRLDCERAVDGAFNADKSLFAIASQVGYVKLWSTDSFAESGRLTGFLLGAHSLTFSPDGTRLATGSIGLEAVKLWDMRSRRELLNMEGQGSLFYPIRFSKDGKLLASAPRHGRVHIWRAPSWEEIEAEEPEAGRRSQGKGKAG